MLHRKRTDAIKLENTRSYIVLRHTLALVVHDAEIVLGIDEVLVRSLAVPSHRFREVLRPTPAIHVHAIEIGWASASPWSASSRIIRRAVA